MFLLFLLYEALANTGILSSLWTQFLVSFIIPVSSIICFSFWVKNTSNKNLFLGSLICLLICFMIGYIFYAATGYIYNTNFMKYPFRTYYLGYAIGMSGFLILLFRSEKLTRIFNNSLVTFISSHSLWIYLWHILFVEISKGFHIAWELRFVAVVLCTLLVTFFQPRLVNWLEHRHILTTFTDILKG